MDGVISKLIYELPKIYTITKIFYMVVLYSEEHKNIKSCAGVINTKITDNMELKEKFETTKTLTVGLKKKLNPTYEVLDFRFISVSGYDHYDEEFNFSFEDREIDILLEDE